MCDCSTIQIPLHLNHLCKPDPPYMMLMPVSKGRGEGGVCTSCLNAHRPQRQRNKTECLFALRSDRLVPPPSSSCGWIAVSCRWIWSIRSINTDYCNPGGQKEGNGPLRVHAANAGSGQICAGMANMCPSAVQKSDHEDLFRISSLGLFFFFFASFQPPAEQKRPHHVICGKIN